MSEPSFLERLKKRKIVQWALAYLAGAWLIFQGIEVVADPWNLSTALQRTVHVLLLVGIPITIVLAWYHGDKGQQRISGPELLILAMLFLLGAIGLSFLGPRIDGLAEDRAAPEPVENIAAALNQLPGIAVLPFANRSGIPGDQYFTDGIQDELLTRLQRLPGLRVISRTSSETYRNTDKTIPEIGRELSVRYVLEGGVQRAGDRARITVQLIDARGEGHLWAETYDRVITPENLLEIQSEIVRTVAGELDIALRNVEWTRSARLSTSDPEAYDLYTRANGLSAERPEEALELFQQAVEQDPEFVGAWVGLARGHALAYQYRGLRSEERAAAARAAAERAVELAPESEDAQLAMGIYLYRVEKAYESALDWLRRASGTLIGDLMYHRYRSYAERRMGRWSEALASHEAALSLSPRSTVEWREAGVTYLHLRRFAEAERAFLEAERLNPSELSRLYLSLLEWFREGMTDKLQDLSVQAGDSGFRWEIAMSAGRFADATALLEDLPDVLVDQYEWYPRSFLQAETLAARDGEGAGRERYVAAVDTLQAMLGENPEDERAHATLALVFAGLGRRVEALREARRALEILPRDRDALGGPHLLFNLASVYARLGEADAAVEVLEDLLSAPSRYAPKMLETHFRLRFIRDDPGFRALMDRERARVF